MNYKYDTFFFFQPAKYCETVTWATSLIATLLGGGGGGGGKIIPRGGSIEKTHDAGIKILLRFFFLLCAPLHLENLRPLAVRFYDREFLHTGRLFLLFFFVLFVYKRVHVFLIFFLSRKSGWISLRVTLSRSGLWEIGGSCLFIYFFFFIERLIIRENAAFAVDIVNNAIRFYCLAGRCHRSSGASVMLLLLLVRGDDWVVQPSVI